MKQRIENKTIQDEERALLQTVQQWLFSDVEKQTNGELYEKLSTDLVYLMMAHLSLYHSGWNNKERWLDNIEWKELKITKSKFIVGKGILWCGNRKNTSAAMIPIIIQVKLKILKGQPDRISYNLEFTDDGEVIHIK